MNDKAVMFYTLFLYNDLPNAFANAATASEIPRAPLAIILYSPNQTNYVLTVKHKVQASASLHKTSNSPAAIQVLGAFLTKSSGAKSGETSHFKQSLSLGTYIFLNQFTRAGGKNVERRNDKELEG
ncbi:hypothetical protein LENED_008401 [Lentinula edodes]|uniref:Uncharacterized protein n=1 Tax=Lentinula edodes TaxID=5353 RepID=A0A1Q3EH01_LENED|nr:hypothetical protein LENED_008401 [Lentinula edodes]